MLFTKRWRLLLLLSIVTLSPLTVAITAAPEAQALIAELGLTEASTPIAKHPGWKPRKIVVMRLALTHNLPAYAHAQKDGEWARGLGMRVIAIRNSSREGPDFVEYVGLANELHALAGKADVIANALPLTPATTGIFDKTFFDAVKPGAIFLSAGRGQGTVTADLITALESQKLYGAGLDVTDPEPLPKDNPLWQLPNVIITPHVSAAGDDSPQRTMIIAVENLRRYVAGEPLLNVVDMRKGY